MTLVATLLSGVLPGVVPLPSGWEVPPALALISHTRVHPEASA